MAKKKDISHKINEVERQRAKNSASPDQRGELEMLEDEDAGVIHKEAYFRYKRTILRFIPWVGGFVFIATFLIPFALFAAKLYCPSFIDVEAVLLASINVPSLGIAGALMVSFVRSINYEQLAT